MTCLKTDQDVVGSSGFSSQVEVMSFVKSLKRLCCSFPLELLKGIVDVFRRKSCRQLADLALVHFSKQLEIIGKAC